MKLMTKAIEASLPPLGSQDSKGYDAIVRVKFFNPCGHGTWLATEYDPNERLFFGWAEIFPGCGELGYFSLDELESVKVPPFGLGIERDLHFTPKTLDEAVKEYE
ncbi:MAG: DUF2958 domain-containing protein [Candidatus Thorarchaeota archaeon]